MADSNWGWTSEQATLLRELREKKTSWAAIAAVFSKSERACRQKLRHMENPDYRTREVASARQRNAARWRREPLGTPDFTQDNLDVRD